jgi:hypothetical protein
MESDTYAFIDPTGLVPVVNEVEWLRRQHPHSTVASTDARSAGGSQAKTPQSLLLGYPYPTRLLRLLSFVSIGNGKQRDDHETASGVAGIADDLLLQHLHQAGTEYG